MILMLNKLHKNNLCRSRFKRQRYIFQNISKTKSTIKNVSS